MKGVLIVSAVNSSIFSGTTSGLLWSKEDTLKSDGQLIKVMIYNNTELLDGNVAEKVARSMYPSCSIDQSLTWQLTCATFELLIVTEKLGVSKIRTTLNLEGHRIPEYFVFDRVAALFHRLKNTPCKSP